LKLYETHRDAFSIRNIKSCFSSTGIYPFNPAKGINRIPTVIQNLPSTPNPIAVPPHTPMTLTMAITTPFTNHVLTSSPSDFTVLQAANSALNRMIESATPLPTPAHKFVRTLTTATEKLYTRTSILQERTEAQEKLFANRQQRASGRRSVIKGKSLLSTPEIHSDVLLAEANTKNNKRRKCI
jgi:hypothetical protein